MNDAPPTSAPRLQRVLTALGLTPNDVALAVIDELSPLTLANLHPSDTRPLLLEYTDTHAPESLATNLTLLEHLAQHRPLMVFGPALAHTPNPTNPPQKHQVSFAHRPDWDLLEGLEWDPVIAAPNPPPKLTHALTHLTPLISIHHQPWFLRHPQPPSRLFVWLSNALPDLEQPTSEADFKSAATLLQLIPLLHFLRDAFGTRLWHNPSRFANLIVDDPPIQDRYGYFAPAAHLSSLAGTRHETTVAFIPWNWKHTSPRAVELFGNPSSGLSFCVHGCDHTGREFANPSAEHLRARCALALHRLGLLQQRTGLLHQNVMVFPQGVFSRAALPALADTGFLAAANSTLFAIDAQPNDFSLLELLQPAYAGLGDLPLFLRHYPNTLPLSLLHGYLGRPLLFVEHHGFFQDSGTACRQLIDRLNALPGGVQWRKLETIATQTSLHRTLGNNHLQVRFFTRRFTLHNPAPHSLSVSMSLATRQNRGVKAVLVNGTPVDFQLHSTLVEFPIQIPPHHSAQIRVEVHPPPPVTMLQHSFLENHRVWLRRSLSNLRDNHPWLAHTLQKLRRPRPSPTPP